MIGPGLSVLDKGPPGAVDQKRGKRSSSDMKRMRIMGLCLVAVFAITAITAVSASALPEVGRCVSQPNTGKYKDAACIVKAGKLLSEKSFEFKKGAKSETEGVGFTASGGVGTLETESGTTITCKTQSATGKYDEDTGAIKEVETVVATFKGCELPLIKGECKTVGSAAGEIKTEKLKGALGYISGEKSKPPVIPVVGQALQPEKAKGNFAVFECGGGAVKVIVKGSLKEGVAGHKGGECVIAPLSAVDVMSTTVEQSYSGAGGNQSPNHFQLATSKYCNLESNANGGPFEKATQALVTTVTGEEALEVKAQ
jgi:hypothetical protein